MDSNPRLVLSTAPDPVVARRLATGLVAGHLAACVNLLPGVTSIYGWEGAVEEASEVLMVIKTRAALVERVESFLGEEHPYATPECVSLAPERVEARYLQWLMKWTEEAGA
ncbi:MAG: periplasmic divalent cation tolerance protein [Planctomycetota bacterium]|jgi:periplasmic divalent cation tolerance protein